MMVNVTEGFSSRPAARSWRDLSGRTKNARRAAGEQTVSGSRQQEGPCSKHPLRSRNPSTIPRIRVSCPCPSYGRERRRDGGLQLSNMRFQPLLEQTALRRSHPSRPFIPVGQWLLSTQPCPFRSPRRHHFLETSTYGCEVLWWSDSSNCWHLAKARARPGRAGGSSAPWVKPRRAPVRGRRCLCDADRASYPGTSGAAPSAIH